MYILCLVNVLVIIISNLIKTTALEIVRERVVSAEAQTRTNQAEITVL